MTTPPRKLTATVVDKKLAHDGFLKIFNVTVNFDRHEGGKETVTREVMDRGHAVAVLAYDPATDQVALANEMRVGALWAGDDPYTDNLIAGNIEAGESLIDAAVRETLQETGLELRNPVVVHAGAFVSSGGTSEKIGIVVGNVDMTKAGGIHGCADEKENIKTTILTGDEFIRQVTSGQISDLKTMVAGYWLLQNRPQLQLDYAAEQKAAAAKKTVQAPRLK